MLSCPLEADSGLPAPGLGVPVDLRDPVLAPGEVQLAQLSVPGWPLEVP
jgi:hypothetical protein